MLEGAGQAEFLQPENYRRLKTIHATLAEEVARRDDVCRMADGLYATCLPTLPRRPTTNEQALQPSCRKAERVEGCAKKSRPLDERTAFGRCVRKVRRRRP